MPPLNPLQPARSQVIEPSLTSSSAARSTPDSPLSPTSSVISRPASPEERSASRHRPRKHSRPGPPSRTPSTGSQHSKVITRSLTRKSGTFESLGDLHGEYAAEQGRGTNEQPKLGPWKTDEQKPKPGLLRRVVRKTSLIIGLNPSVEIVGSTAPVEKPRGMSHEEAELAYVQVHKELSKAYREEEVPKQPGTSQSKAL